MKLTHWKELEPILLAFEAAWETSDTPDLETSLAQAATLHRTELLTELVLIDFEHRFKRSQITSVDDYLKRYPELSADNDTLSELVEHEFRMRSKYSTAPTCAELDSRFGSESVAHRVWQRLSQASELPTTNLLQLTPGTKVGEYEVRELVGSGSFACVYSAVDTRLNRQVAIKLLSQTSELRPELRQRMQREAQALASTSHPNIVPVFDSGTFGTHEYIVTRFIAGQTLANYLRDHTISVRQSCELVRQLASALSEVHRIGVVHRDINLSNIMLEDGEPQLLDFGLAAMIDGSQLLTHDGDLVGTPAFMPPEQADGRASHADARSDVYSLGAVLYRLVCGQLPFDGTTSEVIDQVLHREPRIRAKAVQQIGRDLETIILKCLQKEPSLRYQTANEFEADLQRFLLGQPIQARPLGWIGRTFRWTRRHPVLAATVFSLLVVLGFLVGVVTQLGRVAQQRDLAQAAQRETQLLLAESAANAGQLAIQRGQVQVGIEHFLQSLERGNPNRVRVMLQLVEAYLIQGEIEQAFRTWTQADSEDDASTLYPQLQLWKAELAMHGRIDLGNALVLMEQAEQLNLSSVDKNYIKGVTASSSHEAVSSFRQCITSDPFHFRARRMLILTLLSLGDLENGDNELQLAIQLFPENADFKLMRGLCKAARLQLDDALLLIREANLESTVEAQWIETCRKCHAMVDRPDIDSGMGELDSARLARLLQEISQHLLPLFKQRKWRLPLRIEMQLASLLEQLPNLLQDNPEQSIKLVAETVEIHPEGSLLVVLGGLRLSLCDANPLSAEREVPQLELARSAYRQALLSPGFLTRNDQMIWKAIFTCSTVLGITMKQDTEPNVAQILDSAAMVQSESIATSTQARVFVILAMQLGDNQLAERWTDRWLELADTGDTTWQDAAWHKAVLSKRRERWADVVQWCDALLEANPDFPEVIPLRDFALDKLRMLLNSKTGSVQESR